MEAIWVPIVVVLLIGTSHTKNSSDFVPPHKWEGVTPGRSVPTGLHVRQNLNTEHIKAKLMDVMSNTSNIISVKKASLKAISAATQGNSDVQVVAFQNGVVDQLHSFLKASMDEQDSLEFTTLLSGGVSTLSALLRNFPIAQKQFFSTSVMSPSGFELLAQLSRLNVTNGIRGLRVRILTLLTDLYSERLDTQIAFGEDPTKTKMDVWNIYASIPFEENFLMYGFCETLHISLLQDVQRGMGYNDLSAPVNHDIREKVITACLKFFNVCDWKSLNFSNKQHILSLLDSIIHEYKLRSKSQHDLFIRPAIINAEAGMNLHLFGRFYSYFSKWIYLVNIF
ncbi:unnamed protein product [Schistosoma mattheei]|uniref:Nucleotide exchange factor SIL1 n=1 Tax=Schistosoma mattheei TaxID=31246 RepID=A0AA85ASF3_9TREM|nr:unnamed protein product [Schistosoma mattheei]